MNDKQRLIEKIEQAPDFLIAEVLDFLLSTKNKARESKQKKNADWEIQLQQMANDQEIQAEIKNVNRDFSVTEMDGLT